MRKAITGLACAVLSTVIVATDTQAVTIDFEYYVTRCNALEDNCTIYHVVNGRRVAFQNKNVKVATNTWHTLKVVAAGDHFVVTYDGNTVLDAKDSTFADAGKVGFWTKADSVMAFDDLTIIGR